MKKLMIVALSIAMLLGLSSVAFAEDTNVYVTITNEEGKTVLAQKPVAVTDVDEDGAITVGDALVCAHEAYFEGGAEAGIKTSMGAYGLQLDLLWGYDNGTGYGYLVNNAFSMGLGDPVKDGDYVSAYIYRDLTTWSDTYCFFDKNTVTAKQGDKITLTLSAAGYDANFAQLNSPLEGAKILVNGTATDVVTDAEGKAEITLDASGEVVISAEKENMYMVAPVCVATVEKKEEPTPTVSPTPTSAPTEAPASSPAVENETESQSSRNMFYIILGLIGAAIVGCIVVAIIVSTKKKEK